MAWLTPCGSHSPAWIMPRICVDKPGRNKIALKSEWITGTSFGSKFHGVPSAQNRRHFQPWSSRSNIVPISSFPGIPLFPPANSPFACLIFGRMVLFSGKGTPYALMRVMVRLSPTAYTSQRSPEFAFRNLWEKPRHDASPITRWASWRAHCRSPSASPASAATYSI